MSIFSNPIFVLFFILFVGLLLGQIKIYGLSLGSSGVLFAALWAGHMGWKIPLGVGDLGIALFVYAVGLGVGNRFFGSLVKQGNKLALISLIVVVVGALATWVGALILGIPTGIAVGIFAGACTSTPALAAANEALSSLPGLQSGVSIGYGIAYPFGVAGVVLFVQLLPRLLKRSLEEEDSSKKEGADPKKIISRLVVIKNPALEGALIYNHPIVESLHSRITRTVKNNNLMVLTAEDTFHVGEKVLIVGAREDVEKEASFLGNLEDSIYPNEAQTERTQVIALKKSFCDHTLKELRTVQRYGIVISRIKRLGFSFVPKSNTVVLRNDVLTVVGSAENIALFKQKVGHRSSAINVLDMLSLVGGIALGILVGNIQIFLPGVEKFSLGLAGGPLVVALILGHFGKAGPLLGYMPRPTRLLLQEFGLILFLASAGVLGGADLLATVGKYGASVFCMGAVITILPIFISYIVAVKFLKISFLETLGGICGGITSTPALGAITSRTDSQTPVVSYATAYPVALLLMTIFTKILISILGVA